MQVDKELGSEGLELPNIPMNREEAEAQINTWLSQVSTEELLSLAAFFGSKPSANRDQQEVADRLATAIPQILAPIKYPSIETTLDYIRPERPPKYRSLPREVRRALRGSIPKGGKSKKTYKAIQAAIVEHFDERWREFSVVNLADLPANRDQLKKISSHIKKLVSQVECASIRVQQIIGQGRGEITKYLDVVTLMNALREIDLSIESALRELKPQKAGPRKKRDGLVDNLGEEILGLWETFNGRKPNHSKNRDGVIQFTKELGKLVPIEANIVWTMSFPGSNISPRKEIVPTTLMNIKLSAVVERAIRNRRAVKADLPE